MVWPVHSPQRAELLVKQRCIRSALSLFLREIPSPPEKLCGHTRRILGCVHRHLFDPNLNVASVRLRCGLRNNNISTHFRRNMGIGLREYIETGRLEAAKRLLRQSGIEIYLIAEAVGYEHQETFCRAFQRQMGTSPSHWRARTEKPRLQQVGHRPADESIDGQERRAPEDSPAARIV